MIVSPHFHTDRTMDYHSLPEQGEIERYIQHIHEQIELACSVLINWNNLINKNNYTNINRETKCKSCFIVSCAVHLTEAIQTFHYAKNNLACVTNIYNYLFDSYPKEDNYGRGLVFDAMGRASLVYSTRRIPSL